MIDLHCHLLPYVDDGARDLEEAEKLLSLEAEQGVTALCLTPHLREGMFETPDEAIQKQFERLKSIASEMGLRLQLSREYHYDRLFREKLRNGEVLPMGGRVLLTEFSSAHGREAILGALEMVRSNRYTPLVAHVERYTAIDEQFAEELRAAGALIQINADAVLGYDGRYAKRLVWSLLKSGLVDVIASDAHDSTFRPPRMKACFERVSRKLGFEVAEKLMRTNPENILSEGNIEK